MPLYFVPWESHSRSSTVPETPRCEEAQSHPHTETARKVPRAAAREQEG